MAYGKKKTSRGKGGRPTPKAGKSKPVKRMGSRAPKSGRSSSGTRSTRRSGSQGRQAGG